MSSRLRELVFEIPLEHSHDAGFPVSLLQHSQVLDLLRLDSDGFTLICRVSDKDSLAFENAREKLDSKQTSVTNISNEKSGSKLFQVSRKFLVNPRDPLQMKAMRFFKSIEQAAIYSLANPRIEGKTLRVSVVGDETDIKKLLVGMQEVNVPHRIVKVDRLRARAENFLGSLTWQQQRVLRLAHTLGYYDIPRRSKTRDLARMLKMDQGTVGEHLRRAEKHVFDNLMRAQVTS